MGVDILMLNAGFTSCATHTGLKGYQRPSGVEGVHHIAVFALNATEIASPYDPVRCCSYDAEGEMLCEQTLDSLFDLLEQCNIRDATAVRYKPKSDDTSS